MAEHSLPLFVLAVVLAYVYAFVGGFTDAANAIATSIGTRVLSPRTAVLMAGFFNLVGGLTGTAVAVTIGQGIIDPAAVSLLTVVTGVSASMTWSLFTYFLAIPVSETHGLIGGLVGAAMATAGPGVVRWNELTKVLAAIVISPLMGFAGGFVLLVAVYWSFFRASRSKAMPWFKNMQRVSAAYMAFSHGRNDAQKPMGILALTLALYWGRNEVAVPIWVVVSCASVAALGTAYGGWRIIHTVGSRVAGLDPVQGFAAEFAGASVLQLASEFGIPISTTHAITSSIVGVGVVKRRAAVHWLVVRDIGFSWIITVPIATALGAVFQWVLQSWISANPSG